MSSKGKLGSIGGGGGLQFGVIWAQKASSSAGRMLPAALTQHACKKTPPHPKQEENAEKETHLRRGKVP